MLLFLQATMGTPLYHHSVGDSALMKFAQGPSHLTLNYDGESRKAVEKKFTKTLPKLPKKRGSIVNGKLISFKHV